MKNGWPNFRPQWRSKKWAPSNAPTIKVDLKTVVLGSLKTFIGHGCRGNRMSVRYAVGFL
jgi:hypothetical protein